MHVCMNQWKKIAYILYDVYICIYIYTVGEKTQEMMGFFYERDFLGCWNFGMILVASFVDLLLKPLF